MTIFNEDGTVYKISAPNPIMENQSIWDMSRVILINMDFPVSVVPDPHRSPLLEKLAVKLPLPQVILEEPPAPSLQPEVIVEPPLCESEPIVEPERMPMQPAIYSNTITHHTTLFHCLPMEIREIKDALTGKMLTANTFGNKFTFQGDIVDEEDLYCRFLTEHELPVNSVVYPRNHSRRWWQIQNTESTPKGWLNYAVPSLNNPDFAG